MFQRLVVLTALLVALAPFDRVEAAGDAAEAAYQHARKDYYALKADAGRQKLRHHWRNAAHAFLQVADNHPKSPRAPDALFTAAELLNELSRISRHPDDLGDAIGTYQRLVTRHPRHRLADDGALALARVQLERIEKPEAARETVRAILAENGRGDCAAELRQLLASLPAAAPTVAKNAPATKTPPAPSAAAKPVGKPATPSAAKISTATAAKSPAATKAPTTATKPPASAADGALALKPSGVKKTPSPSASPALGDAASDEDSAEAPEDPDGHAEAESAGSVALVEAIEAAARRARVEEAAPVRTARVNGRAIGGRPRVINVSDLEVDDSAADTHEDEQAAPALPAPPRPTTALASALVDKVSRIARGQGSGEPTKEEVAALKAKIERAAKRKGSDEFTLAEQLGLKFRRVVIDAGHGGHDTGAIGKKGTREKDVALAISLRLAKILEEAGMDVVLTRDDDTFVRLEDRTRMANDARGDLFISVHCNAAVNRKLRGVETYTLNLSSDRYAMRLAARENASSEKSISDLQFILADLATKANTEESTRLAEHVHGSIVGSLRAKYSDVKDLGNKEALFYVLLGARMPAILVETSFLSHPEEEKRLATPAYQERLAKSIAEGVLAFLGKNRRVAKVD